MIVTILNESACASCHAKGACTVADYQEKEIEVNHFSGEFEAGQMVTILFKESTGFTALFWGYILPFVLVLGTLITLLEITHDELISGLVSLGVLVPYYITLYFFRNSLKKIFKFEVE